MNSDMMSLENVRLLYEEDKNDILELINSRMKDVKNREQVQKPFLDYLDLYLLKNEVKKDFIWGAYDNEKKLISTMGMHFWASFPYATLSYMFVRKTSNRFCAGSNGLIYCLHKCLEMGETKGIKAYYSLQKARTILHKRETWRKYDTDITIKYYTTLESVIPKNEKSQYSIVWNLMDKQVWPFETNLWNTRLKPEYEDVLNW